MNKRDTFYFPHEYNAKDDPKCERLICDMGMEGYGIFWALLEVLRVQPDYTYPLVNIPIVAHKYYTTSEQVRRVVFDFGLFTIIEDKIFFSNGLINRMRPMDERRTVLSNSGKEGAKKRWGNRFENSHPNRDPNSHPYSNKSRVNKIREEESIGDCKGENAIPESNDASVTTSADEPRKVAAKRPAFVAPSLQEVKDYISEKGYTVDAQRFIDFYEAKGWMIGKNKMKDWRAAVRTWARRPDQTPNQTNHETKRTFKDL